MHGDDFTVLGPNQELDWFRGVIADRFEVKFRGRLGPEAADNKSIRLLNRVIEWTEDGISYEADQRHAEIIVQELGLSENSKSVNTPSQKQVCEPNLPLGQNEATVYRALVARANAVSYTHLTLPTN